MIKGLNEKEEKIIKDILRLFSKNLSFYYYGSRVKGSFKKGSDLDILIKGNISLLLLDKIKQSFDESSLPFIVNFAQDEDMDLKFYEYIKDDLVKIDL